MKRRQNCCGGCNDGGEEVETSGTTTTTGSLCAGVRKQAKGGATGEGEDDDIAVDTTPLLGKKNSDGDEEAPWHKRFTEDIKRTYNTVWNEENRRWSLITATLVFQVGFYAQNVLVYGILLPEQIKSIVGNQDKARVLGLTMFGTSFISIAGPPIVGMYSDACKSRYGRRTPYMAAGAIINCGGLLAMGFVKTVWTLELAYVIVTFGMMMVSTAFNATIPDLVPADRYGTASGIMGALGVIGFAIGTALGASMHSLGFQSTYAILSSITCATAFITLVSMSEPSSVDSEVKVASWGQFLRDVVNPFKVHDFKYVFFTRLLVQMGVFTVQEYLNYFVGDILLLPGYTASKETAILFIPIGISAFFAAVIIGGWSDRIGKRKSFLIWAAAVISVLTFVVGFVDNFYVVVVIVSFFGVAMGVFQALDYALVCDILPDATTYARDIGVWHISVMLPQLIAAPVGGLVLSQFQIDVTKAAAGEKGGYTQDGYSVLFSIAAFYFALAAYFFTYLRDIK